MTVDLKLRSGLSVITRLIWFSVPMLSGRSVTLSTSRLIPWVTIFASVNFCPIRIHPSTRSDADVAQGQRDLLAREPTHTQRLRCKAHIWNHKDTELIDVDLQLLVLQRERHVMPATRIVITAEHSREIGSKIDIADE